MKPARRRRITLREVAQRAGVSPTTASFVLAGREDMRISAEARLRVRSAAAELDYRPNLTARSLRTKVTQTIALVSDTAAAASPGCSSAPGGPRRRTRRCDTRWRSGRRRER